MAAGPVAGSREGRINLPTGGMAAAVAGILVAEALLFVDAATGRNLQGAALGVHLAVFAYCLLAPLVRPSEADAFVALALLSVFRLVALGMPPAFDVPIYQLLFTYAPMVLAGVVAARRGGMTDLRSDRRAALPLVLAGAVAAVGIGAAEYAVLRPPLPVPRPSVVWLSVAALVMVGVVAPVEELLFRALLQSSLVDHLGERSAILVASGLFGAMHSQYGAPAELVVATAAGVALGWLFARSGSLVLVSVVHGAANLLVFVALPVAAG